MTGRTLLNVGGAYVSKPGFNVFDLIPDQLILNISEKISQLLMTAYIDSSQNIALGVSGNPIILVTTLSTLGNIPGYTDIAGPSRPSPLGLGNTSANQQGYADLGAGGAYIAVTIPSRTQVSVYNRSING